MKMTQIKEVLNDAIEIATGVEDYTQLDISDIVDLGKTQKDGWFDNVYSALLDRLYKLVINVREYTPEQFSIMRDNQMFGAILEKVYVEPKKADINYSWKNGSATYDEDDVNPFTQGNEQTVHTKLFSDRVTWQIPFTIPSYQIRSAFSSESELVKFVNNLFTQIDNDMKAQIEECTKFTVANWIANKLLFAEEETDTLNVVDVLFEFNTKVRGVNNYITFEDAKYNKEFLRFVAMTISMYIEKMKTRSTLFNTEGYTRFTPKDLCHVQIISEFAKLFETYLESDTFHNELVKLPYFESVNYWIGTGKKYSLEDASRIDLQIGVDESDNPIEVEQDNVLGVIFDHDALGVTMWDERTESIYNPKDKKYYYYKNTDMGLFNDLSENGIVFIADTFIPLNKDEVLSHYSAGEDVSTYFNKDENTIYNYYDLSSDISISVSGTGYSIVYLDNGEYKEYETLADDFDITNDNYLKYVSGKYVYYIKLSFKQNVD